MSALSEIFAGAAPTAAERYWPRAAVSRDVWELAGRRLTEGALTLVAYWGEPAMVHLALSEPGGSALGIISLEATSGHFPSIGLRHTPARRFERTIHDLTGLEADGAPDTRPWLDHGRWGRRHPLRRAKPPVQLEPYRFLPVEGESLHQIAVGPVHAGIIEPGHFRFTASGETIVRLEVRLGYLHKGIEGLLIGAPLERAAKLSGRVSGDTTVAYSIAFAEAVEAACGIAIPPRAAYLRALMLELERIANHLGDIGAICNDAAFSLMLAHCAVLRERVLRAAMGAFGHRLMMDRVIPGGVAVDIGRQGIVLMERLLAHIDRRFPGLATLYEETASLQDRTTKTGIVRRALVDQFGAGGFVGRASGRAFDARKVFARTPYDALDFEVPTMERGDVDARIWIRIREIEQSMSLIRQLIATMPKGDVRAPVAVRAGEGTTLVEGFRGDIFVWLRMNVDGTVARCHLRDPSWLQWPLLEAAIEDNIVADFPLCNKSFNCSYAGHDL